MFTLRALSTAARKRGLPLMSSPPMRAETVISLMILVQTFDLLESDASFLCLILDQRLCPDMTWAYHTTVGALVAAPRSGAGKSARLDRPGARVWLGRGHGRPQPGVAARGGRVQALG